MLGQGLRQSQDFGREYVGLVVKGAGGYLNAAGIGMQCLPDQMPAMLGVALLGILPGRFDLKASRIGFVPWLFLGASLLGVTMTLRFFTHDNAQLWPALAVLAFRPAGLWARLFARFEARGGASPTWMRLFWHRNHVWLTIELRFGRRWQNTSTWTRPAFR